MFARTSRYAPAAPGIRSPPRIRATAQNGRPRHESSSHDTRSERRIELSSGLLICGFGVQVPGGAPILTWGYTHFGSPRDGRFGAMVAPRLLVSRDLVAGTAPISWRGGRVWLDWSRPFALNARPSHPANVATQRDTTWQADSQGRQADAGRNCRCRARTSLAALTPGLGTGLPQGAARSGAQGCHS